MGIATFDYAAWSARYPALAATVAAPTAQAMFDEAALSYLDNTDASIVKDVPTRRVLLNMLVAHLAALDIRSASAQGANMVGRVNSVTEGSVSVSLDPHGQPGSQEWYSQTQYGASFWQGISRYRLGGVYVPGPRAYTGVGRRILPGGGW